MTHPLSTWGISRSSLLALCIGAAIIPNAHAVAWQLGDKWSATSNTTLSLGISWSLENPDKDLLTSADAGNINRQGSGINYNGDDGKLNYRKHDTFSTLFKGMTDLDVQDGSQGIFLRVKYWYDQAMEDNNGDFHKLDDSDWQDLAKFKGFENLDAYAWKDLQVADRKLSVKVGKHVLSWGEALFLQNGINAINPLDASAFNRPGVELKEGQLPLEMVSFSFDLAVSLSLEGFWQYNFRPTVQDGCGTFFSSNDNVAEGCQVNYMVSGGTSTTTQALAQGRYLQRSGTDYPSDTGQYGLALHYVIDALNDSDLGVYYANFHSRTPLVNGVIARSGPASATRTNLNTGDYFTVYPEDIHLFGISMSGVAGTTTLFGELSYRPNMPLGYNPANLMALLSGQTSTPILPMTAAEMAGARGDEVQGYVRLPVWQFSLGAADTVGNVLGATYLAWAGEAGANLLQGIGDDHLGRTGSFGPTPPTSGEPCTAASTTGITGGLTATQLADYNADNCNSDGLMNYFSWGYRLRLALNYEDLLPATVVTPSLNWRHDVTGYGPNFQEGQQATGLALAFDYRNNYSLELAYNSFFGSNEFSTLDDRDFASVTLKASF
ncbi:DUF1302 domain-containing protein [Pseudomonas aeruginosa]|uniref:DUF1302 domain-containing protein n=1 Tax=Pseudomonas aeruginosa TaxID=287 RepID=UPI0032E5059E